MSFEDQLALLRSRGLICEDAPSAVQALRQIGYYRLSAYVYPFREMLPPAQQRQASDVHFRSDKILPGTTLDHVLSLWRFDRALRLLVLDSIESIEVGLRTLVAYVLGARNPFGHLDQEHLGDRAHEPHPNPEKGGMSRHALWLADHRADLQAAVSEDYLRHNLAKYEELPIWIAVEAMSFGRLAHLFGLLGPADQTAIGNELGVRGKGLIKNWIETLNYVRNVAAHHSRLWNRSLTYQLKKISAAQVDEPLHHLCGAPPTKKVYPVLAIIAYLVRKIDGRTDWPERARDLLTAAPQVPHLDVAVTMGFPAGWNSATLWNPPADPTESGSTST